MSRNQSSIRFLPKYALPAFCAAEILACPAALVCLRCGDSSGLVDPHFPEPAVRRIVLNGQVMKLRLPLVSLRFAIRHSTLRPLQSGARCLGQV
jgi:hypothetical protein